MERFLDKSILVTGATGALGTSVVKALLEAGCRVRTLSLDPPLASWPGEVEVLIGDITNYQDVKKAMTGMDGCLHLAALLHIEDPPPELRPRYEIVNIDGTANVVKAATRAGVKRLVFFSTISVYGPSNGKVLTEDSPLRPETFYARTKMEAERIVLAACQDGNHLGTALRLGAVYGPGIKGNYRRLVTALAKGRFLPLGRGENRRTLVHEQDVALAALLALEHPAAAGRIYNVSDGGFHPLNEIIKAICVALGKSLPRLSLPLGPVRLFVAFLEKAAKILGRSSPVTQATLDKYTEDMAVDSGRIRRELGFVPRYDLGRGWRETVAEMKRRGGI